jgi:phosphonopyruvate decarboxylase
MGQITTGLFDLMQIPWEYFPTSDAEVAGCIERAVGHMNKTRLPYALVMKKDSVADHKLKSKPVPRGVGEPLAHGYAWPAELPSRADVLRAVQASAKPTDAIVATTGFTGRELYALDDRPSQLYMVGSMGCASTFGLGIAWAKPDRRVIVLDGDGAALMRLGAFATLGYERPKNLVHVLLDNEVHESTGAQTTVAHSVDLAQIARAAGYPKVLRAGTAQEVQDILAQDTQELTFVHAKIKKGTPSDLPRPKVTPVQVAERFRAFLAQGAS